MANVIVDKNKIDLLANAISAKSGEPLTLTLDEMVDAVDGIETGGGGITPTGNINITSAGITDVTNYATATVPNAGDYDAYVSGLFVTEGGVKKWRIVGGAYAEGAGWIEEGGVSESMDYSIVPQNTSVTPTESSQTIGGANYMMEGAVTVNAIPSNYVGSGVTRRSSSDLTASGATVSVPSGFYENNASKAVSSGTEGTPTATKGTVTNHSVSITPSVTNSAGYISGGTHNGTAVSVSASELVSGSETKTSNGTYDVTNLAELVVNVSGGGGTLTVKTATVTKTSTGQTISFSSLSGEPKYWFLRITSQLSSSGSTTYYYITDLFYDGTNIKGNSFRIGSTRRIYNITSGISQSYSGGTLTITGGSSTGASPGQFYGTSNFGYELVYIY